MELKDLKVGDLVVVYDTYTEKLAPVQRIYKEKLRPTKVSKKLFRRVRNNLKIIRL